MAGQKAPKTVVLNYWELTPANWPHHLAALKSSGVDEITTFLPWGLHESVQGIRDFSKTSRLKLEKFMGIAHQAGLTVRVHLGFPPKKESFPGWSLSLGEHCAMVPSALLRSGAEALCLSRLPSIHDEVFFSTYLEFLSEAFSLLSLYRFPEGPIVGVHLDWGVYELDLGATAIGFYGSFLQQRYPQAGMINLKYQCTFRDYATATSAQGTRVLLDKRPWLAAYDYKFCREQMLAERAQGVVSLGSAEPLIDLLSFGLVEQATETHPVPWSVVMEPTLIEGDVSQDAYPFAPLGYLNPQAASVFGLWEYLRTHSKKAGVPLLELRAGHHAPSKMVAVIAGRFLSQRLVRTLREWAESGATLFFPFGVPQYDENLVTLEWKPGVSRLPFQAGAKHTRFPLGQGSLWYPESTNVPEVHFWESLRTLLTEGARP